MERENQLNGKGRKELKNDVRVFAKGQGKHKSLISNMYPFV